MFTILSRLCLLALLIGDWAWDTHFGTDAFTRPMSSSHATHCTSIARPTLPGHAGGLHDRSHLTLLCLKVDLGVSSAVFAGLLDRHFPSSYREPLYVFMSLRC